MSEFITSIIIKNPKLEIKELLISACNSYSNNKYFLDKNFVTKCEMYRSGKKDFKYENDKKDENEDKKDTKNEKNGDNIKNDTKKLLNDEKVSEGDVKGGKLPDSATKELKTITSYSDTI